MKRYALIGTGHRAQMYLDAIAGDHKEQAELVALLDTNQGRIGYHRDRLVQEFGMDLGSVVTGTPDQLEAVLRETRADRLIVTTPDYSHAEYITRGLRAGVDVVVEKPLTIDAERAAAIEQAAAETGRQVIVTFNYRYSPRNYSLKKLVQDGAIGEVLSVGFEWVLDTAHGADYFRRWHREKKNSGGLLIHKASHHFDLVNWWIADVPTRVFASGGLRFYGDVAAQRRGQAVEHPRGTHDGAHDPFELDLRDDPRLKALYLDQEHLDGYLRDQSVFAPGITIEDNMALVVDYAKGPTMSYSLNAHCPWEGYRVSINGTLGRAELEVVERSAVIVDADGKQVLDPSAVKAESSLRENSERLLLQRHWEEAVEVEIPAGIGGHGGGDAFLLRDLFEGPGDDPLGRPSDWHDGMRAIAVGICGNESLRTGLPVTPAQLGLHLDR